MKDIDYNRFYKVFIIKMCITHSFLAATLSDSEKHHTGQVFCCVQP